MSLPVNGERGEVALRIGTVDLVIAAEMGRLAALSTDLKCMSFEDLYVRLVNVEVAASLSAVSRLAVRGDHDRALKELTLEDFPAMKIAFTAALMHHLRRKPGKAEAVREGTAPTNAPSLSGNG